MLLFLLKMLGMYAAWYLVYDNWLLPDGRLDGWLSHNVASVSGGMLSFLGFETAVEGRAVLMAGIPGVEIVNGCNGLAVVGLFVGFVLAYPGRWRQRLFFLPLGALVIYLSNIVRVMMMVLLQRHWPAGFDFMHGLGLTSFFYLVVFSLWFVWFHYSDGHLPLTRASEQRPAPA